MWYNEPMWKQIVKEDFVLSGKFKTLIMYTVYVVILVLLFIFVASFVITMIQPTLFPNTDISGFKDGVAIVSMILGLVSAFLAIYSVYSSIQSTRELKQMLKDAEDRLIKKVDGLRTNQSYETSTPSSVKRGNGADSVK